MVFDFRDIIVKMQEYGISDVLLPFILVFAVFFAILQKSNILGKTREGKPKKNFNAVIALIMGLSFVIPHITGNYSSGSDPVSIINKAMPQIALLLVIGVAFFIVAGVLGVKPKDYITMSFSFLTLILVNIFIINAYPSLSNFILILSAYVIILALLLGKSRTFNAGSVYVIVGLLTAMVFHWTVTGWDQGLPSWLAWLDDPGFQGLVIILLTFFTILAFIMRKEEKEEEKTGMIKE